MQFKLRKRQFGQVFVHHPGSFLHYTSNHLNFRVSTAQGPVHRQYSLLFEQYFNLNVKDNACNQSEVYTIDQCIQDTIWHESMDKVGCTSPFGKDKTQICTNYEKGKKAMEIYNKVMSNSNEYCLNPCKFTKADFTMVHNNRLEGGNTKHIMTITNQPRIKVIRSEYSYPFISFVAEAGGYVGLFLGASFQELGSLVIYLSKKFQ